MGSRTGCDLGRLPHQRLDCTQSQVSREGPRMSATPITDVALRLLANVEQDHGDLAADVMRVPVSRYRDAVQWRREIDQIYHRVPLVMALSADIPRAGDLSAFE